ncbi:hypothetical protein EYC80_004176 [Monilinia laxa]|uniref:Uncharacterized protein n=1 Tax=Monilinia laxa TaxID=61186 RepID=A0A5N6KMB7_MONLA|nr:hypothetical protein EYC80_004176 [Monilinia laxa]
MIGGMALSIGTMMGTRATDPSNYVQKYALWAGFNVTQAAFIAPLLFMAPPAIIARAGLYTIAMMGSISFVGATAKQEKYLYLGGPLLAGVALVAVSGFAPLVLPATAVRTLAFTENIWLWGGLAVFGGFTLYDVQKILAHARMAERGMIRRDANGPDLDDATEQEKVEERRVHLVAPRDENKERQGKKMLEGRRCSMYRDWMMRK